MHQSIWLNRFRLIEIETGNDNEQCDHLLFITVFMPVLRPNFKVGNLFYQILTLSSSDMWLCFTPNFALPGLKVVSRDIFSGVNLRRALWEVVSLFLLVNSFCYEKRDYHSFTSLFEDILNTWLRQRNLPPCCLLSKGVVKSFKGWNSYL